MDIMGIKEENFTQSVLQEVNQSKYPSKNLPEAIAK